MSLAHPWLRYLPTVIGAVGAVVPTAAVAGPAMLKV